MPCAFIKDPATADTILAAGTVLTVSISSFTATTSRYNPITDSITPPNVARTRNITWGTTPVPLYLIEGLRTNLLATGTGGRFDQWLTTGTITVTADTERAPNGENNAQTLNDTDGAVSSECHQVVTVANDSLSHTFSVYVFKTYGATAPTFGITIGLSGGTAVTTNARLNTDNGAQVYGSNANTTFEQPTNSAWLRFIVKVTNNSSGNTSLTVIIYPAVSGHAGVGDDGTVTGSAICTYACLEKNDNATSVVLNRNCLIDTSNHNNSSWTKTRCSVTANTTANPLDGAADADTIVEDATAASTHVIRQDFTKAASSIQMTYSVYVLASGRTWCLIICNTSTTSATAGAGKYFDIGTGALGTAVTSAGWTLDNSTVTSVGGGWYRCRITVTSDTTTTMRCQIYTATGDVLATHNGDSNAAIIVYGSQLVYGAIPLDLWNVSGTANKTGGDVLTCTYAVGTVGTMTAVGVPYGWAGDQTDLAAWGLFRDDSATPTRIERNASTTVVARRPDAGGAQGPAITHPFTTNGVIATVSYTWNASAIVAYSNGVHTGTDDTSLTPAYLTDGATVRIGAASASTGFFNGWVNVIGHSTVLPASTEKILHNGIVPL